MVFVIFEAGKSICENFSLRDRERTWESLKVWEGDREWNQEESIAERAIEPNALVNYQNLLTVQGMLRNADVGHEYEHNLRLLRRTSNNHLERHC